ncbi:MAG: C4-type zinc ribbon domain-containing protein [Candidatus Omnitrophota bacterium]
MENLEEQIKLLVELQGIDSQIFRLEDELELIPETIKNADEAFKEKNANLKELEEGLKALQMKRKEKEGDLEVKEGMIRKYQTQQFQVKTNKEYTALQDEIGRVKADNSIIEEDVINILDQMDVESKKIQKEKEFLKEQEVRLSEDKKKLNEDSVRCKSELEVLKKNRQGLSQKVDKNMLSKYERLIKNRDGVAIVPVSGEACQGCHRVMPPQVINEIRMKKELIFCENCTRILYIEE